MGQVAQQVLDAPGRALSQQAETGLFIHLDLGARARMLHRQVLVAQQRHVIPFQPVEERHRFVAVIPTDTGAGGDRIRGIVQALAHHREVVHHQGDFTEDILQGLAQFAQLLRPGVATDLEKQQRLVGFAAIVVLAGQHVRETVIGVAHDGQVGTGNGVNAQVAPVQFAAHRGGGEGNGGTECGHSGALALPPVALNFRVENAHLGLRSRPLTHEAQQAVETAIEVLHRAPAHILRGKAGVKRGGQVVQ